MAPTDPVEPRLLETLRQDVGRVRSDVRQAGLDGTVGRTFRDLRAFYLSTQHIDRLARMGPFRRWMYFTAWLLKSLFLKLTPARRILLLVGLIMVWLPSRVSVDNDNVQFGLNLPITGVALLLLVLMLELKDKLLAREELEAGRVVQRALMPEPSPRVSGWDTWLFTRPANDVGGDLVDFLQIDPRRACVVLGDVAGKGLPAALLMAKLQATLRALGPELPELDQLGERLNRILCRDGLPNRFATLAYLEISPDSGHVRLLNAGHMPPIVLRADAVEELPRGGPALGVLPNAAFTEQSTALEPGDTLVVYSDGVTEAMNPGGDFYGDELLRASLRRLAHLPADELGMAIVASVDAFVGDAPPHDDLSLVVLRRRAGERG